MRFDNYLKENIIIQPEYKTFERTMKVSEEVALEWLRKNDGWKGSRLRIFRGTSFISPYGIVRPSEHTRKSRNTLNYYTLMIDNFKSWNSFPKRSKSIICSTNEDYASGFANEEVYQVFAKKGGVYGVCSGGDIWRSFKSFEPYGVDNANSMIEKLFKKALDIKGLFSKNLNVTTWSEFIELADICDSIDKGELQEFLYNDVKTFFMFKIVYFETNIKFLNACEEAYLPKPNGFKIMTYGSGSLPDDVEVWTDSDCLLVNNNHVYRLLDIVRKEK